MTIILHTWPILVGCPTKTKLWLILRDCLTSTSTCNLTLHLKSKLLTPYVANSNLLAAKLWYVSKTTLGLLPQDKANKMDIGALVLRYETGNCSLLLWSCSTKCHFKDISFPSKGVHHSCIESCTLPLVVIVFPCTWWKLYVSHMKHLWHPCKVG